ncbi:MAG TPA: ABC transporter permease [Solirubrobacteraceae bacterium]|jgi:peptide/nickel transport system permease protein|nr:ABC transporter permease [Solirubrobacteraceae bacterium]
MSFIPASGTTDAPVGIPDEIIAEAVDLPPGVGPYRLAWRRLRRNRVALAFGALFILIVVLCLLAPVYAHDIAHIGPDDENITGTIRVGGRVETIVNPTTSVGIGPTWQSRYFFGADGNGRDVAVRLLYGGRNSLEIGALATLITMVIATFLGVVAGYFRGLADGVISRSLDVIWAYPAVLLGITLGTILAFGGIGPLKGTTLLVPAVVIGVVYIPYVAKPVRGQVLQLREREFVDAARQQGLGHLRIMTSEILPNLSSTIIVFVPLILANAILLEAALSFLGAGVQPPNPSWGTMITEGINSIYTSFSQVLVPGLMLVLAVLSVNVFGDGLRDAFDPRAKVRI